MKKSSFKLSLKALSILLSIVIVIMSLPISALAFGIGDSEEPQLDTAEKVEELFELTDKRTETTKTFQLEDGSYYLAQYNTSVHYLDTNGNWQDIDNTLAVSGSEFATSNAKIKFAKKTTRNGNIFTLHDDNKKLTLSLNGAAKKISGQITNHETEFSEDATELQKMITLDKVAASVKYENILPGTDLEYIVNGLNIKENIIVKEKQDNYSYSFTMALKNLTAALNDKGEIVISDATSGEAIYLIPASYMYDANHSGSSNVSLGLTDNGNGKYTLIINADSSWINAEERIFPVTIDPPLYTSSNSNILDLDILTSNPNRSSPNDSSIYVSSTWRAYWKLINLPTLPESAYITDAQFTMTCFTNSEMNGYVAAYDVTSDWAADLTYAKVTAATNPQGVPAANFTDFQELYSYDMEGNGYYILNDYLGYYWNITPIVKKWYSGQNYGVMFAPAIGTTFTGTAMFRSNNYSDTSKRPQLCITYKDMKGLEDYWSYTSQSAGFAGTGSINNATGNLVVTIPTLTTTDALMPITPTLVGNLESLKYTYSSIDQSTSGT